MSGQVVGERVAAGIRAHQLEEASDWIHAPLVQEFHTFIPLLDREFKLALPSYPVVGFASIRNAYATYQRGRGEVGTKDNITFNVRLLERPKAQLLGTLLHELLHLWQAYHGTPGKRAGHNAEYREKALACGLVVNARGVTVERTETFTAVLAAHGVDVAGIVEGGAEAPVYGSVQQAQKMKKWVCACAPRPTIVRCATPLVATCGACGEAFHLA